jgi:hypothetical protein
MKFDKYLLFFFAVTVFSIVMIAAAFFHLAALIIAIMMSLVNFTAMLIDARLRFIRQKKQRPPS